MISFGFGFTMGILKSSVLYSFIDIWCAPNTLGNFSLQVLNEMTRQLKEWGTISHKSLRHLKIEQIFPIKLDFTRVPSYTQNWDLQQKLQSTKL